MFHWFLQAGGSCVVVNSDAHRLDEMTRNFFVAQEILTQAGFNLPDQLLQIGSTVEVAEPALTCWR